MLRIIHLCLHLKMYLYKYVLMAWCHNFLQIISQLYQKFPKCFILASCPPWNGNGSAHYRETPNNGEYPSGTQAVVYCGEGLTPSHVTIACFENGEWSPINICRPSK